MSGTSPGFARRFAEGIEKLVGSTPGDHWKRTGRLATRMTKVTELAEGSIFTQRRLVVDTGVPQEGGLGCGHRPEIVYPCIPDSDGEDEGGQKSAAKLLQSDLATLAQREGGE
ncbi:hypothetical protein BHM03_00019605 [Ensete ventricosum]|nr:hypothetical protein BHM03_00019605 [Ensete ventricosum]